MTEINLYNFNAGIASQPDENSSNRIVFDNPFQWKKYPHRSGSSVSMQTLPR